MKRRIRYHLSLILLVFTFTVRAQNLRSIGIENGLTNNTTTSIFKDKTGLMWFGTIDGLNRYDGFNIETFSHQFNDPSSLPDDNVTSINGDNVQNLWIGTANGLGIFDNKTLKFKPLLFKEGEKIQKRLDGWIYAITKDEHGDMYIGSGLSGLLKVETGSFIANRVRLLNTNGQTTGSYCVTAVLVDKAEVWAAVRNIGLCHMHKATGLLEPVEKKVPDILSMAMLRPGQLLTGTSSGLFVYSISSGRLEKTDLGSLSNYKINGLLLDRHQSVWLMTDGHGVIKLKESSGTLSVVQSFGLGVLTSTATYCMYEDELSRLWIGTLRGGVDIINDKSRQFYTFRNDPANVNSLVNDFTFSFCEGKNGEVWIGTDGGGLSIWNRRKRTFQNYVFKQTADQNFNENFITSIIRDDRQQMWISTFGPGVRIFNEKTKTLEKVPFQGENKTNLAWKLYKDQAGKIWSITSLGENTSLYFYDSKLRQFVIAPFKTDPAIFSIVDENRDNFWTGNSAGVVSHVNKRTGIDKSFNLNCAIRSLYVDKKGLLWIGTHGRGLFSYDKSSGAIKNYSEANGLCNNKVLNIEQDSKGMLWMSTYHGLSKFDPIRASFQNFYASDGLQSNQFYFNASIKLSSGELMFGGIKGFNIFNPDSIQMDRSFPKLIITGIRVANTPIDATSPFVKSNTSIYDIDHIRLPYSKAILSLDFAALEYSLPEKIKFSYMLEGKDKSWNSLYHQRNINYSQLDEGNYVLRIRNTNSSGVVNPDEKRIFITISPPWYRTWIAFSCYLLIFAMLLAIYLKYHHEKTRLKFEIKLVKELNEKKIEFFTNIAHELRTPLTLIVNPIKELLHSNGNSFDLIDMSTVYRNSRRLLSLVDQLLLFRSSENDISPLNISTFNLNEVCSEVFLCFNSQVKQKNITYNFLEIRPDVFVTADREKIEIILFNLISNAVKYTPDGGSVTIEAKENNDQIEVSVTDTGVGIPKEAGDKIFDKFHRVDFSRGSESGFGIGLFLASRYIELHHAELSYSSELGKGSEFKVILPHSLLAAEKSRKETGAATSHNKSLLRELATEPVGSVIIDAGSGFVQEGLMTDIAAPKQTILLVDDDLEFRNYLKKVLSTDYFVYEAEDVKKAFEIIIEYDPDIVVSDVLLKGTSGVEFCSKLKESASFSHIPLILLTGSSSPEIKLKGIECGADDYITKPFEKDLLIARIKSTLKGRDLLKKFFINEITLKQNQLKVPAEYSEFISKCINIVERHLEDEDFSTKQFTSEIGMSRSKLFRNIKSISGLTISEFIRYIRLRKAGQLMIETDMQIKEIAYKVGFNDQKHFREQFNKLFQMNPSDFVRKYKNSLSNNKTQYVLSPMSKHN